MRLQDHHHADMSPTRPPTHPPTRLEYQGAGWVGQLARSGTHHRHAIAAQMDPATVAVHRGQELQAERHTEREKGCRLHLSRLLTFGLT